MNSIPIEITRISKENNVSVVRDTVNCDKNYGACAGDEIFLGEFDDPKIEIAAFFHELGHIVNRRNGTGRHFRMSMISQEGAAWETGFDLAYKYGHNYDYKSDVMIWARKQLSSYIDGEYDDTKQYRDEKNNA